MTYESILSMPDSKEKFLKLECKLLQIQMKGALFFAAKEEWSRLFKIYRKGGEHIMKYYLTTTARRKNAKRHIVTNGFTPVFKTIEDAEKSSEFLNHKLYKIAIYNTKWELVKVVNE